MLTMRIERDWIPETRSLVRRLKREGFKVSHVDNGGGPVEVTSEAQALEEATAADSATLHLDKGRARVYLVFGNSPGEIASDYTYRQDLDTAIMAHADAWEIRGQPRCYRVLGYDRGGHWVSQRFTDKAKALAFQEASA